MPVGADKKPLLKTWKQYQTKAAGDQQIKSWWEKWPNANIGIITGEVSGVTVLDIDTYRGGDASKFPRTFSVKTGNGGIHLYYRYAPGFTISANAYPEFPGVDLRGDGGFVVAPYSVTNYSDPHTHEHKGGEYVIIDSREPVPFPSALFPQAKKKRKVSELVGVGTGGRNDAITSMIGKMLKMTDEKEWEKEVWPAVERINQTYTPPLPKDELRTTYESIKTKEQVRREQLILSPLQLDDGQEVHLHKSSNNVAYRDMSNVLAVLEQHPFYKGTLKYNEFRHEIEYHGRPLEEADLFKIQHFLQSIIGLHNIGKDAIYAAVCHYASLNKYDEAQDWLKSLHWDGVPRLHEWLAKTTHVEADPYHAGVGAQWFLGMIRRIMIPGSTFDYVLVYIGKQGCGKTSLFRILGGPWYKSYTGAVDNKDFYLALRGAMILDLDEGASLTRSDAIKIKSIITETHDEYRAPYDRLMKKYPRRFVFSMSTNDDEPFRDITGNRRYWVIESDAKVNFEWITENREQLFAEAYDAFVNKRELPEMQWDEAEDRQGQHMPDDAWTELVSATVQKSHDYCTGSLLYSTTVEEVYSKTFPDAPLERLNRGHEMRIAAIFKRHLGLVKKQLTVNGKRKMRWMLSEEMSRKLMKENATNTQDMFDEYEAE
jgi:predicted P-loop ATPase